MLQDVPLRCRCGEVRGRTTGASPRTTNRVVCYCDDCQAYAHALRRADLLDASGGSDIVQVAPSSLSFEQGAERIACMRLGPKGLYRWYAACCKTPVGNTLGAGVPFVGILRQTFEAAGVRVDDAFGPPAGRILGKFAVGTPPEGSQKLDVPFLGRTVLLVARWKLGGKTQPHPFFDAKGAARYPIAVLPADEREALRALCGPVATSVAGREGAHA
jgi:hypothetical protein